MGQIEIIGNQIGYTWSFDSTFYSVQHSYYRLRCCRFNLTAADIIDDKENRTVIIRIEHSYLETIDINPDDIIIDEVKEGLLARGEIKLTVADYKKIERELLTELNAKFNTVANGQRADDLALEMVKNIYEPIVKTIDPRYSVRVEFK